MLATLLLFYFHPAKIFYLWDSSYIKRDQLSGALSYVDPFIQRWHMPVFLIVAGMATGFALRRRTTGQYVTTWLQPLFVRFVFGFPAMVRLQIHFALRHQRPDYAESYDTVRNLLTSTLLPVAAWGAQIIVELIT